LFLEAAVADKEDFLYSFKKFVSEILIFIEMRKAWRPTKRAQWPTIGPRSTG